MSFSWISLCRKLAAPIVLATLVAMLGACAGTGGESVDQAPQQPAKAAAVPATAEKAPAPALATGVEPKRGGIMVLAHRTDPPAGFDSFRTPSINIHQIVGAVYGNGNMIKPCREDVFKICPGLAESWDAANDFTQWTFQLRNDVKWHDGTPFTAEDVKFWIELAANGAKSGEKTRSPAYFARDLGKLDKVEALDGNRLRITLKSRSPYYLEVLGQPHYNIGSPKHLWQPRIEQGDLAITPLDVGVLGTGPFKFLKFEKGVGVEIRRSDIYWEKDEAGRQLPFLDGVNFMVIKSPSAMDAAFRSGRLDGNARGTAQNLTSARIPGYVKDLGDKVKFIRVGYYLSSLGFNMLKEGPWQDARVRQAVQLYVDKQAAIPGTLGGFGRLFTLLAPDNPYTSPDFMSWPGWNPATREQDKAQAKKLLAEAGYPDGFTMNTICRRSNVQRYEFVAAQVAGLGIDMPLKCLDSAAWTKARLGLGYDTAQGGYTAGTVIPEQAELNMTTYSQSPSTTSKHEDAKVPEFFDRLRGATSLEQRVKIFREFEQYVLVEQAYYIPLFGDLAVTPYRTHVKGMIAPAANVNNNYDFATWWLDK